VHLVGFIIRMCVETFDTSAIVSFRADVSKLRGFLMHKIHLHICQVHQVTCGSVLTKKRIMFVKSIVIQCAYPKCRIDINEFSFRSVP